MSDPDDHATSLAKARNDLLCISNNLASDDVPWDAVCFHAQQAAEKALKAVLTSSKELIPRTHDLLALLDACEKLGLRSDIVRDDTVLLNPYAVASRYPGSAPEPEGDEGREAAAAAARIVNHIEVFFASDSEDLP